MGRSETTETERAADEVACAVRWAAIYTIADARAGAGRSNWLEAIEEAVDLAFALNEALSKRGSALAELAGGES